MKASHESARPLLRVAMALAFLYAPYAWLLLIDHPWNSYRWHWISMWPVLPACSCRPSRPFTVKPTG
jgi:hypothetical protein